MPVFESALLGCPPSRLAAHFIPTLDFSLFVSRGWTNVVATLNWDIGAFLDTLFAGGCHAL